MNQWLPALGRTAVSLGILALGVGGFLLMGTPDVPRKDPIPEPPPLVATQPALEHSDGIEFDVDGVVVPYREIQIAAQVAGRVQFKSEACRSGKTVRKGDLLLRIEPDDYQLEVRRLSEEFSQAEAMIRELDAELKSSENQIASARLQLEIDVRQLQRNQDLMMRKAASDSEVDSARRSELATRNTLQSLIDQMNLLTQRRIRMESAKALVQANLDKAQLNLTRTEIVSPIDGVVVSESVEEDGYVQIGAEMMVLQDTSRLDVTCKLHMQQMHWLWQSDPIESSTDAPIGGYNFPVTPATVIYDLGDVDYAWQAVVDRYDGAGIDSQTRMVPCRVHVDDPTSVSELSEFDANRRTAALVTTSAAGPVVADGDTSQAAEIIDSRKHRHPPTLMTGMFVTVRIHASPPIPLVRLPQEAIQPGNTVWTVQDGKLQKKSISIATSTSDFVVAYERSGGLRAGDLVVTSPLATPVQGMAVSTSAEPSAARGFERAEKSGGVGPTPGRATGQGIGRRPGPAGGSRS